MRRARGSPPASTTSAKFSAPSALVRTNSRSPSPPPWCSTWYSWPCSRGSHDRGRRVGCVGVDQPHLAGDLRCRRDHEEAAAPGAADRHVEAVVVLLEDEDVVASPGCRRDAARSATGASRRRDACRRRWRRRSPTPRRSRRRTRRRGGRRRGVAVAGDGAEPELVALTTVDVGAVRGDGLVGADREVADREVVVVVGELVLVEHDDFAGRGTRRGERIGQRAAVEPAGDSARRTAGLRRCG